MTPRMNGYAKLEKKANPAGNVHEAPTSNWKEALRRLDGAYSNNTIRAYRADFNIFEAWCKKEARAALPATAQTIAAFVEAQSESASPATISRRRASISKIHKLLKLPSPVNDEEVNLATRRVYRQKGRRQKQALGLNAPLKQELVASCPLDLEGLRDRALIMTGYDTLCRRSELVALRIEDIEIMPDGSGTILVRKAKADQLGLGRLAYLSVETIDTLSRWLEKTKLKSGPAFRAISYNRVSERPIKSEAVSNILKARAKAAEIPSNITKRLSGHSMRVGAAQDMAAAGIDLGAIMHAGGWKTPAMVMRYIEHMDVRKSGMARMHSGLRS
jgi:site-specific recombinase XerD